VLCLSSQNFPLVGPFEGPSHRPVVIDDEREDLGLQILYARERTALEHFAHQDAEPDFDLIHLRTAQACRLQRCREEYMGGTWLHGLLTLRSFRIGDVSQRQGANAQGDRRPSSNLFQGYP
jgi:hypothetical protein